MLAPEICCGEFPLNETVDVPALKVPLLIQLTPIEIVLVPTVRVEFEPISRLPAILTAPVNPLVVYDTVPPPDAPIEKLPFIVSGLLPVVEEILIEPEVLSILRFP